MHELGMIDRVASVNRIDYFVEDPRPASGHLQVCHPSPADGLFEPSVALGDSVRQGDRLGHVRDLQSGELHEMPADRDGIVIVLRTFPRVQSGDSVGVVMETDPTTPADPANPPGATAR